MPSTTIATRVHVLCAANCKPDLHLVQTEELGLSCTCISAGLDVPLQTHLPIDAVEAVRSAHMVLVVTDSLTATWADLTRAVCVEAGSNEPIHVLLADDHPHAQSACIGISRLAAVLNTECPVGIDVEDVRMALAGSNCTHIADAKAIGRTRGQDALSLVWRDLGHAVPEASAIDGLLVIFVGASDSLTLKEAGAAIKQLRPDLPPKVRFAYCLLQDDSLGVELHVTAFAAHKNAPQRCTSTTTKI